MKNVTGDAGLRPILTEQAFHILIALGNGPAHGYAIGKDVDEQSGGRLDPTTGTLFCAYLRARARGLDRVAAVGAMGRARAAPVAAATNTVEREGGTYGCS